MYSLSRTKGTLFNSFFILDRFTRKQQIVFLLLVVIISVSYSDETKKNSSIVLTEGMVESNRKGYMTAFRSIVVLYTYTYSLPFT